MRRLEVHPAIKMPVVILLLFLTAFFTPWWGTVIVSATLSLFVGISVRSLSLMAMIGWGAACAIRDVSNQFGPSRVFARMFQLEQMGLSSDTIQSRVAVYVAISLVGLLLALFTAGIFKSIRGIFPSVALR